MLAPKPVSRRSADRFQGAARLPWLADHLLDALVGIARAGGRVHRHAVHQQTVAGLLGRHMIAESGRDLVELTPLGLRVLAARGLERIRQHAAARRQRTPTDPRGGIQWAG